MNFAELLQSASNAAASNVSGPVDLLAWALGKAGVNVGTPVGGSQWMQQRGLTKQVPQNASSLLGEAIGLSTPIAAAAKAPQIAGGLLAAQRNAAIPRQMNPQTGAIVYHGSPHKFDKFDSSKIGTGEGAQAYGHGLYFAENPAVAREYQKKLTEGIDAFDHELGYGVNTGDGMRWFSSEKAAREWKQDYGGGLYKVDLPDEAIAKMLDWDKPLSQQAPNVQKTIRESPIWRDYLNAGVLEGPGAKPLGVAIDSLRQNHPPAYVSDELGKRGIPGIRYLDGGSRGAGSGTSNYVVFPGAEDLLSILERNGVRP